MSKSDIQAKAESKRARANRLRVKKQTITLGEHDQLRLFFVNNKGDELFSLKFEGGQEDPDPHVHITIPPESKAETSLVVYGLKV